MHGYPGAGWTRALSRTGEYEGSSHDESPLYNPNPISRLILTCGAVSLCYAAPALIGDRMAENKTRPTEGSVDAFIDSLPEARRADVRALVKLMQSVSRQKPTMWGPSIIGFGSCHYRYDSGREGDMPPICFSPRKSGNVVYNMGSADKGVLDKLGKHELSGSCLHIKKLSDVDPAVLKTIVANSYAQLRAQHSK